MIRKEILKMIDTEIKKQYLKRGRLQPEFIRNMLSQYKNNIELKPDLESLFISLFTKYGTNLILK